MIGSHRVQFISIIILVGVTYPKMIGSHRDNMREAYGKPGVTYPKMIGSHRGVTVIKCRMKVSPIQK